MATVQSDYTVVRDSPMQLHRVKVTTIDAGTTTAITHTGPGIEPPTNVWFAQTTVATSGDPVFWSWTNPDNRSTKVVNVVLDTLPAGDLTGATGYIYMEFTSSRTTTGGISAV